MLTHDLQSEKSRKGDSHHDNAGIGHNSQSNHALHTQAALDLQNFQQQALMNQLQAMAYPNPNNWKYLQQDMNSQAPGNSFNAGMEATTMKKRKRTNYKDPENASKLASALSVMMNQQSDSSQPPKDLKTVSKMFDLPYNTLRDNYLRATTGQVQSKPKPKKSTQPKSSSENSTSVSSSSISAPSNYPASNYGGQALTGQMGAHQHMQYPMGFPMVPAMPPFFSPFSPYAASNPQAAGLNINPSNLMNSAFMLYAAQRQAAAAAAAAAAVNASSGVSGVSGSSSKGGDDDHGHNNNNNHNNNSHNNNSHGQSNTNNNNNNNNSTNNNNSNTSSSSNNNNTNTTNNNTMGSSLPFALPGMPGSNTGEADPAKYVELLQSMYPPSYPNYLEQFLKAQFLAQSTAAAAAAAASSGMMGEAMGKTDDNNNNHNNKNSNNNKSSFKALNESGRTLV